MSMRRVSAPCRSLLLACGLALALAPSIAAADGAAVTWNQQTLVEGASVAGGTLSLTPAASDWGVATAVAGAPAAFWTPAGTQLKLRVATDIQHEGSNLDGIITVALVTAPVLQRLQAADNIIGLTIAYKKSQSQAYIGLVRKEQNGPEELHGSQYGDPKGFAADKRLTAAAGPIDLTVTVTDTTITVAVPGVGEISSPHGLSKAAWATAYPAVQALNFGPGRITASFTGVSVK